MNEYDYIIVGGGSAGCVLASRLSEDDAVSVCLVEAGPDDKSWMLHVPFGMSLTVPSKRYNWAYETVAQAGLGGRRGYQPRGKVLGGSSAINAMAYIRGHAADYDDWAAAGNPGWSFDDLLPLFRAAENNERGADAFHGVGGPLNVADLRSPHPASLAFVEAARQAGHRLTADFNGASQEGAGLFQVTQKGGRRCSAATAYLGPTVRARPNLTILTETHALKLRFGARTCTGVEVSRRGRRMTLLARRETLLAAGTFGSPQLLLLSGIGPHEELRRHAIAPVHVLPGVGLGLQDHIDVIANWASPCASLLGRTPRGLWTLLRGVGEYRRDQRGVLTSNVAEGCAFLKTDARMQRPDLQMHFLIGPAVDHGRVRPPYQGFSLHVCVLRPKSAGSVTLASSDPLAAPLIDPGFLNHPDDLATLVRGLRLAHDIVRQSALDRFRGPCMSGDEGLDDAALAAHVRSRADTVYHPVGTCRMGNDGMAVTDTSLRVRGIERLRVADASIMPTLIGGNTNAPAIMIGEKAARLLRQA